MGPTHRTLAALRALDLRAAIAEAQNSPSLSPIQKDTVIGRLDILVEIAQRHEAGEPLHKVCREIGISSATFHRWLLAFQKSGPTSLATQYKKGGRKPSVKFTPAEEIAFQETFLQTNRTHGNATIAMRIFSERHPALAQFLSRQRSPHDQPSAVRDALAKLRAKK